MTTHPGQRQRRLDRLRLLISVAVLLACLFYTLADAFLTPYPGVTINSGWIVIDIDPCDAHPGWCEANQDGLQVGDQLIVIGDLTYEDYWNDRLRVPFDGYGPGESVSIALRGDGHEQTIHWQMPVVIGANWGKPLFGLWLILPFWSAGTAVLLFLRPRDRRWRLLVSFNYLTAFYLATGMVSQSRVAASSLALHVTTWPLLAVYLHLHLLVPGPRPTQRSHYWFPLLLHVSAAILAALELFQLLPGSAWLVGLFLAFSGSLGLLAFRLFDRSSPSARMAARLMLVGTGLALGPGIVLWLFPRVLGHPAPGAVAIGTAMFAIPVLPLFHIYALYKRYLGPLEFRANRLLSLYSFSLLCVTALALALLVGQRWMPSPDVFIVFVLAVSMVLLIATPGLRARFQRLVGRLAYGAQHDPDEILRMFSERICMVLHGEALLQLLADEVAPSLLIRQSALYLLADGAADLVYARGVHLTETPETSEQVQRLLAEGGQYRPPLAQIPDGTGCDWVRLAVPLEIRKRTIGGWLFGRRDPDDFYPRQDIELLTSLAHQVAVALENARLLEEVSISREKLRQLTKTLLSVQEDERQRLSHALHDEASQALTALKISLDLIREDVPVELPSLHQRIGDAIALTVQTMDQLRLLARSLRPPSLDTAGLDAALAALCRDFSQHTRLSIDYAGQEVPKMPDTVGICFFRFLQEALTNAGRHSGAKRVWVKLRHDAEAITLSVEDDGRGFDREAVLSVQGRGTGLGLLGMQERLMSVGGQLEIESRSGHGTRLVARVPLGDTQVEEASR